MFGGIVGDGIASQKVPNGPGVPQEAPSGEVKPYWVGGVLFQVAVPTFLTVTEPEKFWPTVRRLGKVMLMHWEASGIPAGGVTV